MWSYANVGTWDLGSEHVRVWACANERVCEREEVQYCDGCYWQSNEIHKKYTLLFSFEEKPDQPFVTLNGQTVLTMHGHGPILQIIVTSYNLMVGRVRKLHFSQSQVSILIIHN